jgi:hypothetical protein
MSDIQAQTVRLFLSVKLPPILLMTVLWRNMGIFTASMRGQSVGLQNLALVRVALGLKVYTARLLLTVKSL